jgi:Cu(I)/Ag(I) efflux system periplasmic protein CusF
MSFSRTSSVMAACLSLAAGAFAGETTSGTDPAAGAAPTGRHEAQTPLADALVRKLDRNAGTVTLSHGPLPNGMPAMTMDYRLKDASWFGRLKEGQRIRVAVAEVAGVWTLVRFEPSK